MKKIYYLNFNIGKTKYVVSYHDGVKKHDDGSNFYDIAIFKNKVKFNKFIGGLLKDGYREKYTMEDF